MQFAGSADVRGRRQGLDLPRGYPGIGGVKIDRLDEVHLRPFDKGVHVGSNRRGRWIIHTKENRIEHWPRKRCEIGHQLAKLTIEIAKKQQGLFAEDREAGVVDPADAIRCLEQARHELWKLLRHSL